MYHFKGASLEEIEAILRGSDSASKLSAEAAGAR